MSDSALADDAATAVVSELIARGAITEADVLRLRREVFADGRVGPREAQLIFALDQACRDQAPAWCDFYVEALTDHFVHQAEPKGYLDEARADQLLREIARDGRLARASELELLVNILDRAVSCPEKLALAALEGIRRGILAPEEAVYGDDRRPGVIEAVDVALLRTVIHSGAGAGSLTVTRDEAELLFELNQACDEAACDPAWRDLFIKAIGSHLMFPRAAPAAVDPREAARREAWLSDRESAGLGLLRIGRGMLGGFDPAGAWAALDPTGGRRREAEAAEAEAAAREAGRRQAVDAAEAAWLVERLDADGMISANERALLAFVGETASEIHEPLRAVIDKAGL